MAEQLMSRGGALFPQDHQWVNKLMAAYDDADQIPDGTFTPSLADPWAEDTRPIAFEPLLTEAESAFSEADPSLAPSEAHPAMEARRLRDEARSLRARLQPVLRRSVLVRQEARRRLEAVLASRVLWDGAAAGKVNAARPSWHLDEEAGRGERPHLRKAAYDAAASRVALRPTLPRGAKLASDTWVPRCCSHSRGRFYSLRARCSSCSPDQRL
jgi:hypothetical protein